jgi:hypothetical protein
MRRIAAAAATENPEMYAVLGEIEFDLITYFDGLETQFGSDYAEHALIGRKPRLQFVGEKLDEVRIDLVFHVSYCDPEAELVRLKTARPTMTLWRWSSATATTRAVRHDRTVLGIPTHRQGGQPPGGRGAHDPAGICRRPGGAEAAGRPPSGEYQAAAGQGFPGGQRAHR